MRVTGTARTGEVIDRARGARSGRLTITIGTGCCESTAPFLYEDFWPGPDQEIVGEIAGVEVFAPEYLRKMYGDDDVMVIDVHDGPAESMSIETEWDCRLFIRGLGVDTGAEEGSCVLEPTAEADEGPGVLSRTRVGSRVKGEMPEQLRSIRLR